MIALQSLVHDVMNVGLVYVLVRGIGEIEVIEGVTGGGGGGDFTVFIVGSSLRHELRVLRDGVAISSPQPGVGLVAIPLSTHQWTNTHRDLDVTIRIIALMMSVLICC